MLSQQNRLTKDKEIKTVLLRGRGLFNPFLTLKYRKTVAEKRFAVVVSTKVAKEAVRRNRLKRIIRETLKARLNTIPLGEYVLICRPASAKAQEKDVLLGLNNLLSKLR